MVQIDYPKILDDNTISYLEWLVGIVEYSNPESNITFRPLGNTYQVVIEPSNLTFRQDIIENVLHLHHRLKLPITYSKSLAISRLISFEI